MTVAKLLKIGTTRTDLGRGFFEATATLSESGISCTIKLCGERGHVEEVATRMVLDQAWCDLCAIRRLEGDIQRGFDHKLQFLISFCLTLGRNAYNLNSYQFEEFKSVTRFIHDPLMMAVLGMMDTGATQELISEAWKAGYNRLEEYRYQPPTNER